MKNRKKLLLFVFLNFFSIYFWPFIYGDNSIEYKDVDSPLNNNKTSFKKLYLKENLDKNCVDKRENDIIDNRIKEIENKLKKTDYTAYFTPACSGILEPIITVLMNQLLTDDTKENLKKENLSLHPVNAGVALISCKVAFELFWHLFLKTKNDAYAASNNKK